MTQKGRYLVCFLVMRRIFLMSIIKLKSIKYFAVSEFVGLPQVRKINSTDALMAKFLSSRSTATNVHMVCTRTKLIPF